VACEEVVCEGSLIGVIDRVDLFGEWNGLSEIRACMYRTDLSNAVRSPFC
jgi:hypothetical protein